MTEQFQKTTAELRAELEQHEKARAAVGIREAKPAAAPTTAPKTRLG